MAKIGFNWITPVVCVSDLPRSLEHYESVLGFDINWAWSEGQEFEEKTSPTFACVCRGEISIFLCEKGQGNPGSWLCVNVANVDELEAIFAEYKDSGANIVEPPQDYSWGMREMVVQDQDGNTLRVGCSVENAEPGN